MRLLAGFLLAITCINVHAAYLSYRIDSFGELSGSILTNPTQLRFYQSLDNSGGSTGGYWVLDGLNNTVERVGAGGNGARTLNTSAFTVNDILDVTWTTTNGAWITTGDNMSYRIDASGNITNTIQGRYYQINDGIASSFWLLDGNNNTVQRSGGSGARTLNTSLFTVNDIIDLTWTAAGTQAWVTTASNMSYRIDDNGNVVGSSQGRFYQVNDGNNSSYWFLDGLTNQVQLASSSGNGLQLLNIPGFSVNDIIDLTWTNDNEAWVIVAAVPLPAAFWLFATCLTGLIGFSTRKKQ